MIRAIILAAGESSRMGQPKMLLPFGQASIIETVITGITASCADDIVVVLGAEKERISGLIKKYPVSLVYNPAYPTGMLSSVQAGFAALPDNTRAALIVLGDQPDVSPAVVDLLIKRYNSAEKGILLPVQGGKRGHPVLIDMKYRKMIANLDPAVGLRALMHAQADDILQVEVDDPAVHQDIDNLEDYANAVRDK